MGYKYDSDLEFLQELSSETIKDFCELLYIDPKDGGIRYTQSITISDEFKKYGKDYAQYWRLFAEELQHFGGNTVFNVLRGNEGVLYREILCDVCDKMKVSYKSSNSTEQIECYLLQKTLDDLAANLSPKELAELSKEIGTNLSQAGISLSAGAIAIFKMGGFKSYQLSLKLVNLMWRFLFGRGLRFAANRTVTKTLSIATGPIGWAFTGAWTVLDIASPAYRVTYPAVLQIALLRQTAIIKKLDANGELN